LAAQAMVLLQKEQQHVATPAAALAAGVKT
jgi:hypothetical protein